MNRHALQVLQFPETLDVVAGFAAGPLGAAAVRALEPSDALGWVQEELHRVEEMLLFSQRAENYASAALPNLNNQVRKLSVEGSVLDPENLRDFALFLASSRDSKRAIDKYRADYPRLAVFSDQLVELEPLEKAIAHAIADDGTVRDNASRELASIRRDMRGARARIVQQLEAYVATLPARYRVEDASITVRDGRYVVPIRREGRSDVGGIVHDESATGNTLFIEPPLAIEAMNRLRELELAEVREIQRILRELTNKLRPHARELQQAFAALVELDSLWARAHYARRFEAHRPEMIPAGTDEYVVVTGYHPLLLATGASVVPFDLILDPGERTLLVSGPNTGGKTVLLKAIGLISALAQAGIMPPVAARTKLPIFEDIFADIGDEQSIEASLSTFSAHLKNIREILDGATHTSLVLMDEVGSGTDPAEGGAIAQAVLVELTRRGTMTVATTHLGQLKLLAGEEPGVINASLQFDAVELRPTYRLLKGIPGRSYGIAIARRLGFPKETLASAEAYLPKAERDAAQLLTELEEKDRAMSNALAAAEAARAEVLELREELERREKQVRTRERDAERRARQQARDLLLNAREEVEATIRELRAAVEEKTDIKEASRAARARVEEVARRQLEKMPESESESGSGSESESEGEIEVGATVRVAASGAIGKVIELRDGKALVEISGLRMQVPVSGLRVTKEKPQKQPMVAARGGWTESEFNASSEVDLRGLRAEEVASQLQPAVDAAVRADLPSLRIIHGKGTGALRQVVIELLRGDPRVKSYRAGGVGEGGVGVTVAQFS